MTNRATMLRVVHGLLTAYFLWCLGYLYYAVFTAHYGWLLTLSLLSLGIEGILVYGFSRGDCPLIHLQKRVGDEKPFFELLLPSRLAKLAMPIFAGLGVIAVILLLFAFYGP